MNDISNQFKRVFVSQKNARYILGLLQNRFSQLSSDIDISGYYDVLLQIQNVVFETYFPSMTNQGKPDFEQALIQLNTLTIDKLEQIIMLDLQKKYHQSPQATSKQPVKPNMQVQSTSTQTETPSAISNSDPIDTRVMYHHLFSTDSSLEGGRYTFPMYIKNNEPIKSINIMSFKITCNMYNITDENNKFIVYEKEHNNNSKILVSLPIGYYKLDELICTLSSTLNNLSVNKLSYQVTHNKTKNKIYFKCFNQVNQKPSHFTLKFLNEHKHRQVSTHFTLQEILGYTKEEYSNNNVYVSENFPSDGLLDNMYLKVFLNNKELDRFSSSKNTFSYFDSFQIDMTKNFGKTLGIQTTKETYDILETIQLEDIGFELWSTPFHIHTRYIDFEVVVSIEY